METNEIFKTPANLYGFAVSQSGNLILTTDKLIFQGTLLSKNTRIEIELKDIASCAVDSVSSGIFASIIPMKVIVVTMNDGKVHKFRVTKQDEWVKKILDTKASL